MICKNLETGKYFNYQFIQDKELVKIGDNNDYKIFIPYKDWCKDYLIIDKWRDLNEWDIKYNKDLDDGKFSSS